MHYSTESQIRARDTHRHISLIANAGSGKTTVLVDRYIDIIQQGLAGVQNVVALTFTEKAAGELRKRIASAVIQRRKEATDPAERRRLELLREQLSSAVIGTIHSFCAQLLREHPVDVPTPEGGGIDASFTILEGIDQHSLLEDSISDVFQKLLQPGVGQALPDVAETVRMLGRSGVLQIVRRILEKREILDHLAALYEKPDAAILARWKEEVEHYLSNALPGAELDDVFRSLASNAHAKYREEIDHLLAEFLSAADGYERLAAFTPLTKSLLTEKGSLLKKVFRDGESAGIDGAHVRRIVAAASVVKPFVGAVARIDDAHALLLKNGRTLLNIAGEILNVYSARKAENALLDFDDLQLYVKALLSRPEIRERLSAAYTYIMVDEFQDTNRLQYDILISLVENYTRGNLFIVGDPKQSIYGFRNADVGIFMRAIDEMAAHAEDPHRPPGGETAGDAAGGTSAVTLAESFRLLPALGAFVNVVFGQCMDPAANRFSVPYERLVIGRPTPAVGRVELLLPRDNGDDEAEAGFGLFGAEEEMIARRIMALCAGSTPVYESRTGEARPIRFGDIAILMRSRTNLDRLEQALLHYHIPYLVFSGGGFYQTQELYDFFNYFQFLLNPHDDGALAGILRSPFFACSDAALYRISRIEEGGDFWTKACRWVSRFSDADPQLSRAVKILQAGLLQAGRKSLTDLIAEIIEQTGYSGIAAASRRAAQHSANIEKLLLLAASFESRGFSNLYDFVERLRILIDNHDREGQASIDEAENAVHIMTIHAAKGLEFNAVIVPYLHRNFYYDSQPFLDESGSIGFACFDPADYDEEISVPVTEMLRRESVKKTEAEEQRIFYVAFTRARDILILSAFPSSRSGKATMYSWIQQAFQLDSEPAGVLSKDVTLERLVLNDGAYRQTSEQFRLEVACFRSAGEFSGGTANIEDVLPAEKTIQIDTRPIPSFEKGDFFTASQIRTFHDCPLRYHLAYHLGMPEVQSGYFTGDDGEEEEREPIAASAIGSLVHRVLQDIDTPESISGISDLIRNALLEEGLGGRSDVDELGDRVGKAVRSFCSSDLGRRALASDRSFTEYTIEGKFGGDFIRGTIDRLIRSGGRWEVIDYKTDSLDGASVETKNEAYRYQMMVYAWLVSRMTGQESVPVTLFYTGRPEASTTQMIPRDEITNFEAELGGMIRGLRGEDYPANLAHCPSCPYARNGRCIRVPS